MAAEPTKTTLEQISVQLRVAGFGPNVGKKKWFVCRDGVPWGESCHFFEPGFLKHPYPFKDYQTGVDTEEEANELAFRLMEHITEVVGKRKKIMDDYPIMREDSWVFWTI